MFLRDMTSAPNYLPPQALCSDLDSSPLMLFSRHSGSFREPQEHREPQVPMALQGPSETLDHL